MSVKRRSFLCAACVLVATVVSAATGGGSVTSNVVETLTDDTTLSDVHSLKAVNPTPETPLSITATASYFEIGDRYVTIEVAANTTLTLDAPVNGTIQKLSGDGDFVVRVSGKMTLLSAANFTGHLTVKGGVAVLPKSLEGRVRTENEAQVNYASLEDLATHSVTFTVTGYQGTSTLTNFPVLVRLSETTVTGISQLPTDMRVLAAAADSDETYPCDVETWNPSGESLVWVRLPELKPAGTSFRLLFGKRYFVNASGDTWRRTDAEPSDGTTDTGNFAAVWHMASDSGEDVPDATGNGLTAVPYTNRTTKGYSESLAVAAGAVGTARQVSAVKDANGPKLLVSKAAYNARQLGATFTASCWARLKDLPGGADAKGQTSYYSYPRLFSCKEYNTSAIGWEIEAGNVSPIRQFSIATAGSEKLKHVISGDIWSQHDDKWDYFTFVYNGTTIQFYANGALLAEGQFTKPVDSSCPGSLTGFYIGGAYSEWSFAGEMDEARLFDGVQSADWIAADYATQANADFLTAGPLEGPALVTHSVTFTVSGYQGASTLTNFPVLVRLSETTVPGISQFGKKTGVWAASADGKTRYPCDVETWEPAGESIVWVRLSEVKQEGTSFRLLFAEGVEPVSSANTWRRTDAKPGTAGGTGNFAGVWHMAAASREDLPDATGNGLTAVPYKGTASTVDRTDSLAVAGAVGVGRQISSQPSANNGEGSRLRVAATDYAKMKVATNFTVSAWVYLKQTNKSCWPRLFAHGVETSSRASWQIMGNATKNWVQRLRGTSVKEWTDTWKYDQWVHYVFVFDGRRLGAYVNGASLGTYEMDQAEAGLDTTAPLFIGGNEGQWHVYGSMDEVRLFSGALSDDWVKADYDSQKAGATFLSAGSLTEETQEWKAALDATIVPLCDKIDVRATIRGEAGTTHTITAKLFDEDGNELKSEAVSVTCPAEAVAVSFAGLSPMSDYRVTVTATDVDERDVYAFDVMTIAQYLLLGGDTNSNASFGSMDANAASWANHKSNWSNTVDGTILDYPSATSDFDFVLDATMKSDPASNAWMLRTHPNGIASGVTFPGRRLTIVGTRTESLTYQAVGGGGLGIKNYESGADKNMVAIRELCLKNGSVWNEAGDFTVNLQAKIEIPSGFHGYFECARDRSESRYLALYGSLVGEGTATFCLYGTDVARGFYLHNDLSAFAGKFIFDKARNVYFCEDCTSPGDLAELTEDGITLDNRYHMITASARSGANGASRLIFEADTTWATPNRGITVDGGGTAENLWHFMIRNGKTVTLENPLYGSGNLGLNGEDAEYQTGILKLCGAQGDWSGAFSMTNGTLVLAGAKPLGDGALAVSGTGKVELDASALAGGTCYLKAVAEGQVEVKGLPELSSEMEDFAFLATPATDGVTRDQILLPPLPDGVALRSFVVEGLRTFAVGKKRGIVIVVR